MKQLLSIIAHNRPGVLSKITGLISRRGYNIDSLMSGTTEKPALRSPSMRMTAP